MPGGLRPDNDGIDVFRPPEVGTAMIESTGWTSFGRIVGRTRAWRGAEIIPWETSIAMDILESFESIHKATNTLWMRDIKAITSKHLLGVDIDQPYYIYTVGESQFVGIGVDDRSIESFGMGNLTLDAVDEIEWDHPRQGRSRGISFNSLKFTRCKVGVIRHNEYLPLNNRTRLADRRECFGVGKMAEVLHPFSLLELIRNIHRLTRRLWR